MTTELINTYDSGRIKIALKGTNPAIVNTIRRCIIDLVPTMAIHDVELVKNSSVLYDEMIAHRLGLLALSTDLKSYTIPAKCTCEGVGCSKCTLKLTLKAKGPCIVLAEELKSKDPKIKPVHQKTPIVKLLKGQELELEATAALGRGREHAKWAPGLVWYTFQPKITVNNDAKEFNEFKDKFPPQVFKDSKLDKKLIEDLDLVDACDGVNESIVKVEYDPSKILLSVEPWGQLSVRDMLVQATEAFQDLLSQFETAFDKAELAGVAEPGQMR